jgi:hypothetical protein
MDQLTKYERWLPAAAGLVWWTIFYPGFFGDDSLIHLADVRSGNIPVWFTAWWMYVVKFISLEMRAIPLLSLSGVIALQYAVYHWITTAFPRSRARSITVLVMAASPLIGAMGIQVRHDIAMTSALLLCAAVLARTWNGAPFTAVDYALLALSVPLLPTRHNGVPTIVATAAILLAWGTRRWRQAVAMLAVAAGAWLVTATATRTSGNTHAMQPAQTVEWLMGDISCLLSRPDVIPTESEWATLERIAERREWPQPRACLVVNPIMLAPSFSTTAVEANYGDLIGVWRSLAARYPLKMAASHASRVRLFLPPPFSGPPEVVSFLHSTIMPNDLGLAWQFPAVAEPARVIVRAWNAMSYVLANSALWLVVMMVMAWRLPHHRAVLMPAIIIGAALNLGLIAAAPISEGRYGLFILICGQATSVYLLIARGVTRSATHSSDRSSMRASRG